MRGGQLGDVCHSMAMAFGLIACARTRSHVAQPRLYVMGHVSQGTKHRSMIDRPRFTEGTDLPAPVVS
jgi:hypothetical protein